MHDESLNQDHVSPEKNLDERLIRALETVPEVHISADFAARVARQLPTRRQVSLTPTHYGYSAMVIGMVLTLVALLSLALHATGHAAFWLLESLLFAQFIALTVWFSVWRHSLR